VPDYLAHPPIRPSASDAAQSVFRVESAKRRWWELSLDPPASCGGSFPA
jgi:hypothetical protein